MSHELRTPLTNILGQLEELDNRISKTQNEAEYSHSLRSALRSSRKMDKLIEELLLLARAQSRNLDKVRLGSWSNLVKNAIDETELQGIQHTLQLDLRPTSIRGDAPALTNALVNLLINAYRHTPPSSLISIQSWESAENVLLRIRDNGPGISEEMRARIWERYVKGEHPDSTGIGLALVKAIIEAHDGAIILEESKQGSSFLISLPRASESIVSQETGSSPEDSTAVTDTHSSAWQ
jgi:signal transduction histidine kinase